MKKLFISFLILGCSTSIAFAQKNEVTSTENITRILNTLASDEMEGRSALGLGIWKAADFIAAEFKAIGLKPYAEQDYKQSFDVEQKKTKNQIVKIDGKPLASEEFLMLGDAINPKNKKINLSIGADEDFSTRFREIMQNDSTEVKVQVDAKHAAFLARFKRIYNRDQITLKSERAKPVKSKLFYIAAAGKTPDEITNTQSTTDIKMFNVAAILPGKSKPDEYVIFSAHYDHIGILPAVDQDSIANGADDDASGTTAMIELARYYKQLDNNERTIIFVAFTAEEIGMFGSKYFSNNIDPEKVVAMINIEMIGKDSKFGLNSLYVTGYDASDLGKLMQENVKGSKFTFHPDPYKTQNLFYRSDNAVLAALGVPAHTFSTSQIDKDQYYHTVKDEVSTLDIQNIKSSIEAIAKGAIGIIQGKQTPTRVEKLRK